MNSSLNLPVADLWAAEKYWGDKDDWHNDRIPQYVITVAGVLEITSLDIHAARLRVQRNTAF